MLNIHLNGEVVLTPDFINIKNRTIERYEAQGRCKYGMEEIKCNVYYNFCHEQKETKPLSKFGRCPFAFSDCCPNHQTRKKNGLMKKNYGIDNRMFRKMQSASHYLIKSSEHKTLFLTLTFPPFKKINEIKPNEANKLFSKFMHNLRKRHGVNGYIAVRETGTKFGRLHFHLCISMPYVSFSYLNCYWCHVIRHYCKFSFNALQVDPKNKFIKNPVDAMFYVSKYFSKSGATKSESRVVFISNNLLSEKYEDFINTETGEILYKRSSKIKRRFNYSETPINDFFKRYPKLVISYKSDYATGFKISTTEDFNQFCNEFLYKIFDLPAKSPPLITGNN